MSKHELLAVIRNVEWSGANENERSGNTDACPCCGALQEDGKHGTGCEIARAIAEGAS